MGSIITTQQEINPQTETIKKRGRKKSNNYLNNKDMLEEVRSSLKIGKMTDKLALMLMMLTKRYGKKANFAGYTYNDDMQSYALMMLCKTWSNFNPDKSDNPFAYYTQCIKNCFKQYLVNEKKHRNIRDKLLVLHGKSPSHTYQIDQLSDEENTEQEKTFVSYQFEDIRRTSNDDYDFDPFEEGDLR